VRPFTFWEFGDPSDKSGRAYILRPTCINQENDAVTPGTDSNSALRIASSGNVFFILHSCEVSDTYYRRDVAFCRKSALSLQTVCLKSKINGQRNETAWVAPLANCSSHKRTGCNSPVMGTCTAGKLQRILASDVFSQHAKLNMAAFVLYLPVRLP